MYRILLAVLFLVTVSSANAALSAESAEKNQPVAPFKIIDNIYYVGASEVTSYLFVTTDGLILLDGGFAETAAQIEKNIATLGFKLKDVKILLNGHAHPDHAGGLAALKRDSGATFEAMEQEVIPLEHEGRGTFYRGEKPLFESIKVDKVLHDNDKVTLGDTTLVAHLTAGHSPGCTTWSTTARSGKRALPVVVTCQLSLPAGQALVGNALYPSIAADFRHTFEVLQKLPVEVFLAEHGSAYGLQEKIARTASQNSENVFIDPAGYKKHVVQSRDDFEKEFAKQSLATKGNEKAQ